MRMIRRALEPTGRTGQRHVVLNQNAVVEDGHAGWRSNRPRSLESRSGVDNIINLPLAGRKAGVDQRWVLAVDSSGGTIGISLVLVRIEDLYFIAVQAKKHAAIPASLALAMGRRGRGPFNMQLAIAEILDGSDVAAAFDTFHVAITGDPFSGGSVHACPLGEVFAIEENDGV